jgi:hypothetical protein
MATIKLLLSNVLPIQDRDLIRERVERLRKHAEQLLGEMSASVASAKQAMVEMDAASTAESQSAATADSGKPPRCVCD